MEQSLKRQAGVSQVKGDLEKGIVDVSANEGESLDVNKLKKTILISGFSVRHMKVTATGRLSTWKDFDAFKVIDEDDIFLLIERKERDPKEGNLLEKLKNIEGIKEQDIKITGEIHEHKIVNGKTEKLPWALALESFNIEGNVNISEVETGK